MIARRKRMKKKEKGSEEKSIDQDQCVAGHSQEQLFIRVNPISKKEETRVLRCGVKTNWRWFSDRFSSHTISQALLLALTTDSSTTAILITIGGDFGPVRVPDWWLPPRGVRPAVFPASDGQSGLSSVLTRKAFKRSAGGPQGFTPPLDRRGFWPGSDSGPSAIQARQPFRPVSHSGLSACPAGVSGHVVFDRRCSRRPTASPA